MELKEQLLLQREVVRLRKEVYQLKRRGMLKHSAASLKWRNQAFYYKKANRALREKIRGLEERTRDGREIENGND